MATTATVNSREYEHGKELQENDFVKILADFGNGTLKLWVTTMVDDPNGLCGNVRRWHTFVRGEKSPVKNQLLNQALILWIGQLKNKKNSAVPLYATSYKNKVMIHICKGHDI